MVRVSTHMGWTFDEAMNQPREWIALLAADLIEQNRSLHQRGGHTPNSPHAAPGRTTETVEYRLRPKR